MSIVTIVRSYAINIQNGRTLQDILNHLVGEAKETQEEIDKVNAGEPEGDDGVVGEAIDMIQCGLDLIFTHKPYITEEALEQMMTRKCEKWRKHYKNSIEKADVDA